MGSVRLTGEGKDVKDIERGGGNKISKGKGKKK